MTNTSFPSPKFSTPDTTPCVTAELNCRQWFVPIESVEAHVTDVNRHYEGCYRSFGTQLLIPADQVNETLVTAFLFSRPDDCHFYAIVRRDLITLTDELKVEIDTREYWSSHMEEPDAGTLGMWLFRNELNGETVERNAHYSTAVASLPAGRWVVLP